MRASSLLEIDEIHITVDEDPAKLKAVKMANDNIIRLFNLVLFGFVVFSFGTCSSLFSPFFPTEAAKHGVSATTVGFIFGMFTLAMFVGTIVAGRFLRTLGLKFMIWAGTFLAGGTTIIFGLLDMAPPGWGYVTLCFVVRLVEGVGASLFNTAAYAILALLYPKAIATHYAVLESVSGIGRTLGPTLGGLLYTAGGFSFPFYVVGIVLLVFGFTSLIFLQCVILDEADFENEKDRKGNTDEGAKQPLSWSHFYRVSPEIWILSISLTATSIILSYTTPTISLYFDKLGLRDPIVVGLVFLGGSLAFAVMALISGRLADSYPNYIYQIMAVAAVIIALGALFVGPTPFMLQFVNPSTGLTVTSLVIMSFAMPGIINSTPAAIINAARAAGYKDGLDTSAMVASLYNGMWFLGSFVGFPLAGFLMDLIGFEWGAFVMSILAAISALLLTAGAVFSSKLRNPAKVQPALAKVHCHDKNKG